MNRSRLLACCFIVGVFTLSALLPLHWVSGLPLCCFHALTGWDCPGCGLTRAFIALFHGKFREAIEFNALAPVLVLLLLIYLAEHLHWLLKHRRPIWFSKQGSPMIGALFLVLFLGQWVLKTLEHWHRL